MAEREFTITELQRAGDGGFIDTPVKFTWTNDARSAPRGSWKFGVQLRTVREDYPGVEQPVEQVLGPNYKEFSINGVWDDRYNFGGFALDTMRKFEAFVQRGSLCRIEFETVSITGLIKDAEFDYRRAAMIGYSFTVSPHYRNAAGLPTSNSGGRKGPEAFKPITEYRDHQSQLSDDLINVQTYLPTNTLGTGIASTNTSRLAQIQQAVSDLSNVVDHKLDQAENTFESTKRIGSALSVIKGQAAALLVDVATLSTSTSLAWDDAMAQLNFDTWRTQLAATARLMALDAFAAQLEMSRRAEPKAVARYRPRKGESLYSISQRFYGTPSEWQRIAVRNGLTTITLQGTEVLIIPERT